MYQAARMRICLRANLSYGISSDGGNARAPGQKESAHNFQFARSVAKSSATKTAANRRLCSPPDQALRRGVAPTRLRACLDCKRNRGRYAYLGRCLNDWTDLGGGT